MSETKKSLLPKVFFIVVLLVGLGIGAAYLAGLFMLVWGKAPVAELGFSTYYQYWYHFHEVPAYAKPLRLSALGAVVVAFGIPFFLVMAATSAKNRRSLHGSARFARSEEIRKAGLFADNGVIVGKVGDRYMMCNERFVLLAAPTRSGKGTGFAVPNALNWQDSMVVLDIKNELFKITAGFRAKHGQDVFLFNPFAEDLHTSRYNPLGYVRDGDFRVGDLIAIGEVFYPSGGKDAFFDDQARNLFVGLGLYLCETPFLPRTIGEMLRQSSGKGQPIKNYLQGIINARNFILGSEGNVVGEREWCEGDAGLPPLSGECVDSINRFLSTSDNTRSSILASFNAPLTIWTNPIVDAATSANDFDLREVRKRRMSVYIGITPDHLAEAGRLVGLLFSQLVNLNTKELPENNPALKYKCFMLLDEFTAIGKIPIMVKAVSYMAGYGLFPAFIIQSNAQLRAETCYGAEGALTITSNCALKILYEPNEQKDANDFSEVLGYETVKGISKGRQFGGAKGGGGRNENESDQRRALLLPQEIKEIGDHRQIVVTKGIKPIFCDKVRYFDDPVFMARLLPAPAIPLLDMDTHRARVQHRIRETTLADLEAGIDLSKLALDMSMLKFPPEGVEASPENIQALVDSFFDMIDAADCAEDGTSPPPSPEELAALDASAFTSDFNSIELAGLNEWPSDDEDFAKPIPQSGLIDLSRLEPESALQF